MTPDLYHPKRDTEKEIPMKKLPLICSLAALVLALTALGLTLTSHPAARNVSPSQDGSLALTAQQAYCLEQLDHITDLVLERQVIPADCLRYVDDDLAQAVEAYNDSTVLLKLRYTRLATDIVDALVYEHAENPGDYQQPELYFDWIGRIAHYALYEDTYALCAADPVLGYTLAKESGGSYGLWPGYFHDQGLAYDQDLWQLGEDYFAQVDALLEQLDGARAAFSSKKED